MRLTDFLVVLLILTVLMAVVAPKVVGGSDCKKSHRIRSELSTLKNLLDRFQLDCGRYPTTSEGLQALTKMPADFAGKWDGPYAQKIIGSDPWGYPYVYRSNGKRFKLISWGMDGAPGGEGENADFAESSTGNATPLLRDSHGADRSPEAAGRRRRARQVAPPRQRG